MTLQTWPDELPRPERSGYQTGLQDPRAPRQSEYGPRGWKRRFSSVSETVSLSILVSRSQLQVFKNFYADATGYGVGNFWCPDPTTDGWALLNEDGDALLTEDGSPILLSELWLAQFGENPPTTTVVGIEFRIQFSLEVMP